MKTLVVGDIHGCGLELHDLLVKANMDPKVDQLVLVGDLFDRAKHGHLVWAVIEAWGSKCYCLEGNHERKMLKWLRGERPDVPKHYIWAVDNLEKHGISRITLRWLLESMPPLLIYSKRMGLIFDPTAGRVLKFGISLEPDHIIITHAGINIHHPLDPDPSFTVYGDVRKQGDEWWERYTGENLVLYGHLSQRDMKLRKRYNYSNGDLDGEGGTEAIKLNSIGLDTACAHGGSLTGYIIETGELVSVPAQKDWASELKMEMK